MKEAIVYIFLKNAGNFVPAGRLRQIDDNLRYGSCDFRYGHKFLEREDRIAVDPVALPLPLNEAENRFETVLPVTIFGAITDACPDQWGQFLMSKAAGRTELSDWEYIMATGPDRVGALAFGLDLSGPQPVRPWPNPAEVKNAQLDLEMSLKAFQDIDAGSGEMKEAITLLANRGGSVGGARPKATVEIDGELWLAKFPRRDDKRDEVHAEFATMTLAKKCGLNIPSIRVESSAGTKVFLIKRFDRTLENKKLMCEHFVSGLTLLNEGEMSAYHRRYGEISARIQQLSVSPREDCEELFKRMLFNILVNNSDDHARNHGMICQGQKWRLSPLFDVVVAGNTPRDANQALGIGKMGRKSSIENALSDLSSFGIEELAAKEMLETLRGDIEGWEEVFADCGVSEAEIRHYQEQGFGTG